jgi:hypothetical protein
MADFLPDGGIVVYLSLFQACGTEWSSLEGNFKLPIGFRAPTITPLEYAKMAENDTPTDEAVDPEPSREEAKVEETPSPPPKEKVKRKESKPAQRRTRLTVLQAAVLETIRERAQRPRAIRTIIRGVGGVDIPQNEIIRSLNELKEKGLVDKVTSKAWQAK